jgi:hypothetical protein
LKTHRQSSAFGTKLVAVAAASMFLACLIDMPASAKGSELLFDRSVAPSYFNQAVAERAVRRAKEPKMRLITTSLAVVVVTGRLEFRHSGRERSGRDSVAGSFGSRAEHNGPEA